MSGSSSSSLGEATTGLRGLPPEELRKNLTAIVRARTERHVPVGAVRPWKRRPTAGPAYATAFRDAFSRVARDEHVPFVTLRCSTRSRGIEG
jgi:lysophospholipase L1-like esterase